MYIGTERGQWIGKGTYVELIPGTHKFRIAYYEREGYRSIGSGGYEVTASIEAGHVYELRADRRTDPDPERASSGLFRWRPDFRDVTKRFDMDSWLRRRAAGVDMEGWRPPDL